MSDRRVPQLLQELLDLPEEERPDALSEACADDPMLRKQLENLLALEDRAKALIESVTEQQTNAPSAASGSDKVPENIGPYRIERVIAEGGMGVVYLARQDHPISRTVALKVIKWGLDSAEVAARFEQEYQALALLSHRNVAQVHDVGTTNEGRPYFVMEYVDGIPITNFCRQHALDTRQQLALFETVCNAVQHAHQRGLIHRDLKPSNVLVVVEDGKPVPKIIDFGIAKSTEQKLTERTLYTELGQIIGTPEYMSPEQAELGSIDIDTRTDVYSLGVMLYELLVGERPLDSEMVRAASYGEIQRVLRDVVPTRPSARVRNTTRAQSQTKTTPTKVPQSHAKTLRGDLDWITMKCLEKERDRRYHSASELAADIRRYLAYEPIVAGPPSTYYRLRKFARKHRGAFVGAASIVVALAVGLAWALLEKGRAETARAEIVQLADIRKLNLAMEVADTLWPPHSSKAGAMKTWLQKHALPLQERLQEHIALLERLRETALPYTDEDRRDDQTTHPDARRLAIAKSELEKAVQPASKSPARDPVERQKRANRLEAKVTELTAKVETRRTYRFEESEVQWQHDTLADLVARLEKFVDDDPDVGTIANVRQRLQKSQEIETLSATSSAAAEAWAEAISDIQESPVYKGLHLRPQMGLLPLRKDAASGLWEFWCVETGVRPEPTDDKTAKSVWTVTEETGLVFVLIPGATFVMGAQASDANQPNYDKMAGGMEKPPFQVELAPYFLSKYEMTQAQWQRIMRKGNPAYNKYAYGGHAHTLLRPVEFVNWLQVRETLRRVGLVMPTEAQWEFGARGGSSDPWSCGSTSTSLQDHANLADRFCKENDGPASWLYDTTINDGHTVTAPVGSYNPNGYGLHDVHGNVWEWCLDHFFEYDLASPAPGNGLRQSLIAASQAARGGGYDNTSSALRCTYRYGFAPTARFESLGVRPARAVDVEP